MPGPVSDSFDPEFGTGANSAEVSDRIREIVEHIGRVLGPQLFDIVGVAYGGRGKKVAFPIYERDLRVIRFACNRALESI